jgi:phage shock protein C
MDTHPEPRRLFRSHTDKRITGVLGGIAEFFQIDATWTRLAFMIFFFLFIALGGFFLPIILLTSIYGTAWFVIPPAAHNVASFSLNKNY